MVLIKLQPVQLECDEFETTTFGDLLGYPWIPACGQVHLKRLMAWFVFASVCGIAFQEICVNVPILFSITLLLAISPFAIWTWLSLRSQIVTQLLQTFEVWFMILNFMGYSISANLLLQHAHLPGLHVFLDMIYFILLVPLFALLDALPTLYLHKFKVIYGFNAFFLGVSIVRVSVASTDFETWPLLGFTVPKCWITSTVYSTSFNLIAFLINNLYISYKHPDMYVLWKVGMKETAIPEKTSDIEEGKMETPLPEFDIRPKRTPSMLHLQQTIEEPEYSLSSSTVPTCSQTPSHKMNLAQEESGSGDSESEELEIHARTKTLMGFYGGSRKEGFICSV